MKKDCLSICILRSNPIRPDSRVEKEALALSEAGHKVHIFAWDRDSNHPEQTEKLTKDSNIYITRVGLKASFGDGFKNLKQYLCFQGKIMHHILKNRKEYDVIHACDFDTAYFSSKVTKLIRKKFVFDIFDFIHGDPRNLFQKIIKKAQINLINYADATIICTEERKRQIKEARPKRVCVIHNSPPTIETAEPITDKADNVSIVYVGILQDYRLLLEIGEYFKEHPQFTFNIGGFGKYEDYFKQLAEQCANINFYGRLQYKDTLKLEQNSDIMLAIYDPSIENHRFAAPNKFYEALMLGKPLIMVEGTGMSNGVRENDLGVLITYDKNGFDQGLLKLVEAHDKWEAMGDRMKRIYKEKYSWNEMARRLLSLYEEL